MATASSLAGSTAATAHRGRALALRTAIVLATAGAASVVAANGLSVSLVPSEPVLASSVAFWNARSATAAAQAMVEHGAKVQAPRVRTLVQEALARDATLTSAIELRAMQAKADGDNVRAARLFGLSDAISRRSLPTRLWLIQRAVDHGDVAGALENFDIALRTSTAAPSILFPVLARAATDPALTKPLARVLDRPGDWRLPFLQYAITEAHAASGIAAVMLHMHNRHALVESGLDQVLVGQLVADQAFGLARQVRGAFHPLPPTPSLVADPDFSNVSLTFPFGWGLVQKGGLGAERAVLGGKPALQYQSAPGAAGPVAVQLLTLPVGNYRLWVKAAESGTADAPAAYWTLTCAEPGGRQIALLDQPAQGGAAAQADFAVAPGCKAQWLALSVMAGDNPDHLGAVAAVRVGRSQTDVVRRN